MKLIHLSDLHLGKRLNEFSLLEDQAHILLKILQVIDEEQPDAVLIAGDVYDKSVPSAEAVELLDDFLVRLAGRSYGGRKLRTFVISGNHDSPERLAFGSRLMAGSGVYISPVYSGRVEPVTLTDECGQVRFYLLPFVKPGHVRRFFPEEKIESYTDALRVALREMKPDFSNGQIKLKNYPANAPVRVASLDGKLLMETKVDSNGESCILLDKFPKGVIIIQVDKMNMKVVNKK